MRVKKYLILIFCILIVSSTFVFFSYRRLEVSSLNVVEVNDIVQSVKEQWGSIDKNNLPGLEYQLDYVILDHNDTVIASTKTGLHEDILTAIKYRDTILKLKEEGQIIGTLIIYNDINLHLEEYRLSLLINAILLVVLLFLLSMIYIVYIDQSIFKPFRKLQKFTQLIAQGNLDLPLDMDKNNWFGSFTESFDIMRSELYHAKERERLANQSKKELVASLSHDIKTPVASIKAVCEVMLAKSQDQSMNEQLNVINNKAEQINTLINNLFNATLEELQELKVNVSEESSHIITSIIQRSDYNHRCDVSPIPDCIVMVDPLRIEQVIDNVLSNSYKYANTKIDVASTIKDGFLEISFKDYGLGVEQQELPLLINKYYRGQNSKTKKGTGLGLYIANFLMNRMSGEITFTQEDNGFCVTLKLLIA